MHANHAYGHASTAALVQDAELVDMEFGTGAVKITPAHDPNDFKAGQRHGLPMVNIFDDGGSINENGGQFAGQPRFEARRTVVAFLQVCSPPTHHRAHAQALKLCGLMSHVVLSLLSPSMP